MGQSAGAAADRRERQRPALGLRARIVIALMLTSAATLAVAALTLLGPLETRLRKTELSTLLASTQQTRGVFEDLGGRQLAIQSRALRGAVHQVQVRTGAQQVLLLDTNHVFRYYVDKEAADADPVDDVARAFASGHVVRSVGQLGGDQVARVAAPLRIDGRVWVLATRKQLREVTDSVATIKRAFATAALSGLAIALIIGVGFAATVVRRLRRLRDAALLLAERGPSEQPLEDRAGDEVGDLTRAFATMQQRLHHQEEARRAFVATASHELRTPVASLQGMLELLDEDLRSDRADLADAREQVGRARVHARRLGRLAADLLDLSRLDAEVQLRHEPVELGELARAVLAEFEQRAADDGVELALETGDQPAWALADPGSVARILRILLDNALRVSPHGARLEITLGVEPNTVSAIVADVGPGIPDEDRERIFERFQRGTARDGGGFGLGLAIGRELAERMGGTLELDGERQRGAAFRIRLPRVRG
jgi:signal transduction histidine kinase